MDRPNLLIVDDQEKNIKLLNAMLFSKNYRIHEALSGEQALLAVADCHPDLILLDVMMPGIDGFEVCRRLKQDEKTRIIPILMVTALRAKEHRIEAMEAGADDFLNKPVDQTELLVRVQSMLRIKSYHDNLLDSYNEIAEKNARLQELERTKEGLTHMIIHDLKNSLMAMSGNLEMVLFDQQMLSQTQVRMLRNCLGLNDDLNDMIQGLLDIHKMEAGKLEPRKKPTNLVELINGVVERFIPKAAIRKISVCFEKSNGVPPIMVDDGLVKRIVANLLSNAIRYSPTGGRIEVTTDSLNRNDQVGIRVKDYGIGLDQKYHQKVFEKFEQMDANKTGLLLGASGLGLFFCKMAVEAHGGKIWVDSEGQGKGSQFCFTLPV